MSVIVKGMEMPYQCAECDFCGGIIMPDGIYCCDCPSEASHGKNISDAINNDTRADFCPLIELPPHGRLIDADKLVRIWTGAQFYGSIKPIVDARPTIIEAEGETE